MYIESYKGELYSSIKYLIAISFSSMLVPRRDFMANDLHTDHGVFVYGWTEFRVRNRVRIGGHVALVIILETPKTLNGRTAKDWVYDFYLQTDEDDPNYDPATSKMFNGQISDLNTSTQQQVDDFDELPGRWKEQSLSCLANWPLEDTERTLKLMNRRADEIQAAQNTNSLNQIFFRYELELSEKEREHLHSIATSKFSTQFEDGKYEAYHISKGNCTAKLCELLKQAKVCELDNRWWIPSEFEERALRPYFGDSNRIQPLVERDQNGKARWVVSRDEGVIQYGS